MTPGGWHYGGPMASLPSNPPASTPAELRALWPLVVRFGVSDDRARDDALRAASVEDLKELVAAVGPVEFDAINAYLDETHDAEEAVPFGDLAQAAMEAMVEIAARE